MNINKFCIFTPMKTIIIVIFGIICCSCSFNNKNANNEIKEKYSNILNSYPQEIVEHFPDLDEGALLCYDFKYPKGKYLNGIKLVFKMTDDRIQEISDYAASNNLHKYSLKDSCLMMTKYDESLYESMSFRLSMCEKPDQSLAPVPNFAFCNNLNLPISFYNNAIIYVLDAQKGAILSDHYLSRGVGLPEEWLHGFSKGIVISENIVIYWLEVW